MMTEVDTAPDMVSNGVLDNANTSPDSADSQSDPRKLFVGGIPYDAVAQDLLNYFERYGPIREAVVIRDKNNPLQNQGYGFVIFEDPQVAQWVLTTEKNPIIKGRKANVQKGHKRSGLPSVGTGLHAPSSDAASILPPFYYEPLGVVDTRDANTTGILPLNQVSWPMTNERLLAAAALAHGYQYGAQPLLSVQDQSLQWTQNMLVQQQQQQNSVYLPQAGVILPTSQFSAAANSSNYVAAAAAAAGMSPSSSWPTNNLVHHNNGFNLLGAAAYVPTAAAAVTQANAVNAFAAAVAAQQQVNGLIAAPASLCTAASQSAVGGANPHALWRETSPIEAQANMVTYVASPSHSPPTGITSLTHILEQSNGVA